MPTQTRNLPALCALALIVLSMLGCAQNKLAPQGVEQNVDCRSCHSPNGTAGAKDFSAFYTNPKSHHPVGVRYPPAPQAEPNFKMPNGRNDVAAFFDRNGNGQPDNDEVMLFGPKGAVTVECASCHREHGNSRSPGTTAADPYLRVENTNSALCMTCHRQ
ncbi:MAG: cytochrome c3 family protein [Burkholderiales bacterium]